jgi:cell division protein FtsB
MTMIAAQLVLARAAGAFQRVSDRLYRFRRKLATAGVGLLALVLAFHIVFGANGIVVYQKKRAEYRTLQKDLEQLQKDNQALSDQIRALKTDPQAIEREAREQLRYARPGEVIYLMPRPRPAVPPANAAAQNH